MSTKVKAQSAPQTVTNNVTTKQEIEQLNLIYGSFAVSLMSDTEMQANLKTEVVKVTDKKASSNVCSLLVEKLPLNLEVDANQDFESNEVRTVIALDNQTAFFRLTKDGNDIVMPDITKQTRQAILTMVKNNQIEAVVTCNNKQVKSTVTPLDKLKVAFVLWVKRSKAVLSEIAYDSTKETQHAKTGNLADLGLRLTLNADKSKATFTGIKVDQ